MASTFGMRGPTGLASGNRVPAGYEAGRMSNFTPEQMQLFQQLFSHAGPESFSARIAGGDQSAFNQLEAPALRQFNQLTGNVASRFSGMGSFGGRRSSGFQNALGAETSNFAEQLQSQRLGLQRQALQDLMGISNSLLGQRPYEQFLVPKKKSFLEELGIGLSGGFGSALGGFGSLAGLKYLNLLGMNNPQQGGMYG